MSGHLHINGGKRGKGESESENPEFFDVQRFEIETVVPQSTARVV